MADIDQIPHFDIDVLPESLEKDFEKILQHLKPDWKKEDVAYETSAKDVSRGLLNTMVKCYNKKGTDEDAIMIRVLNTKMNGLLDRSTEVTCIKYFMKMDCAPKILATFKTGFCYEYIIGEILNSNRIGEDPIWKLIAEELAKFHSGDVEDGERLTKQVFLHKLVDDLWVHYPTDLADPEKDKIFKKELPSKAELQAEVEELMEHCQKLNNPIVLCHNDTRGENIIWNAELGKIFFVDFEVMGYGYQAAEIAAHLSRYCGLTPPDYSKFPSEEFQKKWLRHYLEKYNHYSGNNKEVTDKDVQRLYIQVKKFYVLCLILAGLGGPAMEAMNILENKGFDMLEFSYVSTREYYRIKEEVLKLSLPE